MTEDEIARAGEDVPLLEGGSAPRARSAACGPTPFQWS